MSIVQIQPATFSKLDSEFWIVRGCLALCVETLMSIKNTIAWLYHLRREIVSMWRLDYNTFQMNKAIITRIELGIFLVAFLVRSSIDMDSLDVISI